MRLTILGSGTMMPTLRRYPAAYLLEDGEVKLLLDCGHLTIARLLKRGINLHDITAVAISHFHTDHFSHLFPLVHARWVDDIVLQREHRTLTVLGPVTIEERFKKMKEVMWPEPKEGYPITFKEGMGAAKIGKLTIQPFAVQHVPWFKSVGYRITDGNNKSVVYTGDLNAEQKDGFEQAIANVEVLLIEAGAVRPSKTHFTAEQAAQLAQRCGVKKVLLTHIREDFIPRAQETIDTYPNLLSLAEDGMTIEI